MGRSWSPRSWAAASATASCPLPPSTTKRSGASQAPSSTSLALTPASALAPALAARVRRRLHRAPEPPREHLVHRSVVVVQLSAGPPVAAARHAPHVERAVALLVELPVRHRHDGADRVAAAEVRDVAALDAPRQRREGAGAPGDRAGAPARRRSAAASRRRSGARCRCAIARRSTRWPRLGRTSGDLVRRRAPRATRRCPRCPRARRAG